MKHFYILLAALFSSVTTAQAGSLDDIRQALEQSSVSQVQEKVYIHTDNTCYFVGDTLWYKAYVVRADNLQPTDMSRILYVELLSPDGLLVERQNIIVAPEGHTCGQFVLQDSLYSGYYELRAYTRWMLNFGVSQHKHTTTETWQFYNRQMAADYYRLWDGLYSRVLPIYGKPDEPGDYDARRMYQRPKQRLPKQKKEELFVTFYPEGGSLVQGLQSRVAFDVVDQLGQAVDNIQGTVMADGQRVADISTTHLGRGLFTVTPGQRRLTAHFTWRGKNYTFDLPRAEQNGVVLTLDGGRATLQSRGLPTDRQYGVSILCRGALQHFAAVNLSDSPTTIDLPVDSLPAGVNDLTVFDSDGRILADRLFFRGSGLHAGSITSATPVSATHTYAPYAPITIDLLTPAPNTTFSLAVRDTRTDEPTYNNGNLLTDLLLSSELRGFIAHPAYYFERDDEEHRRHLDLLMMVQGWRKYQWRELADTTHQMRYEPEVAMTVSGAVYKMLGIPDVEQEEVTSWPTGVGRVGTKSPIDDEDMTDVAEDDGLTSTETIGQSTVTAYDISDIEYGNLQNANDELGVNHGGLKHEVLVEAEVIMGDEIVGAVQKTTNGGRFLFQIPPFYGATYLNMKAYKEKDSLKKAMTSRSDVTVYREDAFADFYVKRDMPYPIFTHEYNYYENHAPDWDPTIDEDSLSEWSMENEVHQLGNINVKGRRRGKRAIDWKKPAYVRDAYDLYNDLTDYGLSFGKFDMRQFPLQVAKFLFGNMGRLNRQFNVDGRLDGLTYWRNYDATGHIMSADIAQSVRDSERKRAAAAIYNNLKLARLQDIRVFSDYEPRNEDSTMVESLYAADATVEMVNIPDDGKQVVFRDRHIYLHGFNEPAEFYQPNYADRQPATPTDYRRTLYWNPNARSDEEGRFSATFYNNAKDTRIKISAAGVTPDGCLLIYK